jgi:hypothetical protein
VRFVADVLLQMSMFRLLAVVMLVERLVVVMLLIRFANTILLLQLLLLRERCEIFNDFTFRFQCVVVLDRFLERGCRDQLETCVNLNAAEVNFKSDADAEINFEFC